MKKKQKKRKGIKEKEKTGGEKGKEKETVRGEQERKI